MRFKSYRLSSIMKKALRIISIIFLGLILILFIGYLILNESKPVGTPSPEADELARRVEQAMNKVAWDTTKTVSWTFRGENNYEWDKEAHVVNVTWGENEVILEPASQSGVVISGENYTAEESTALIKVAWDNFNNDSFWLCAPYKLFDPETERSLVAFKDGRKGLMITYTSGGTTPGDSYVWIVDENYMPVAIKMWVKILPIGGMEFSWENYKTLSSGAMVAQDHWFFGRLNVDISNLK